MWPDLGPIKTWGVLYGLSILSFFPVSYLAAGRLHLRHRVWITLSLSYLVGMTIGAKALYDLQHGAFSPWSLFRLEHWMAGGMWGGGLAYLLLAVPAAWALEPRRWVAVDAVALSLPIPLFLTKVGCLLNGCCHGKDSSMPWAIAFPEGAYSAPPGVPTHPTQLYELLVIVLIFVVFKILDQQRWRGTMLFWLLALYGLGRAITEIWRADLEDRGYVIGPLSLSQILCVVAAGFSVLVLYLWRSRRVSSFPDLTPVQPDHSATRSD